MASKPLNGFLFYWAKRELLKLLESSVVTGHEERTTRITGGVQADSDDAPIIGIDLGMTSILAAHVQKSDGVPKIIPTERGQTALASVVSFANPAKPQVGRAARDQITISPERTVTGIKRLLGRSHDCQAVRDLVERVGYKIMADGEGRAVVSINERVFSPSELAGFILARIKAYASNHLKKPINRAVVAVPAYFNAEQKNAVIKAGELAGINIVRLVHEPTAVALAYGYDKSEQARIVIIDMGGVRLDISVMEITRNVFDVVATSGDPYLGGANLDTQLVDWILSQIKRQYNLDLTKQPALLVKVRTAAEQAKRELSRYQAVDLQIPLRAEKRTPNTPIAKLRLERKTVEKFAETITHRLMGLVRFVLRQRNLSPEDIDDVILVGGATRTPVIHKVIENYFGKEPKFSIAPEEVIALGSALLAESLGREEPVQDKMVESPIGIALSDGRFMKIIDKKAKLPITRRIMIPTTRDNQKTIEVDFFQGEQEELFDANYLGTILFPGLPEKKAGQSKLIVDMTLSEEYLLTINCPDVGEQSFQFITAGHQSLAENSEVAPTFSVAPNPQQLRPE
ncbi:MAG: Hsp70 family protein [Myxococcota bacterium]|nr:Hsp70 family protein [Myxococcota bacterium]